MDVGAAAVRAPDLLVPVMFLEGLLLVEGLGAVGALELVHRHGWTSFPTPAASVLAPIGGHREGRPAAVGTTVRTGRLLGIDPERRRPPGADHGSRHTP